MNEKSDSQEIAPPAKKQKVEKTPSALNQNSSPKQDSASNQDETERHPENNTDNNPTASDDRYINYVTPEEVEKLKEFRVLDEVKSNDEDSNDCEDSDSSTGESADLPEEEIEKMLEEDLPDDFKVAPKPKEKAYITREKIILEEKGVNHFEVLPLDWIMIRHQSGIPVYVHRATRVCTLSKPYFLGKGNAKRHDIPISAIPCLAYRRALEEEERQKLIDQKVEEQIKLGTWNVNKEEDKTNSGKTNPNNVTEKMAAPIITDVSAPSQNKENKTDKSKEVSKETVNSESQPRQCPFKSGLAVNSSEKCPVTKEISSSESALTIHKNKDHDKNLVNAVDKESGNNERVEANKAQNSELNTVVENGICGDSNEGKVNIDNPSTSLGNKIEIPANRQPIVLPGGIVMPSPRVETVNTSWKTQHLTHDQVNEYCKKLFKFKVLKFMHFKRWADRRKYTKARKALQYPMLPEGTKLITIPVQSTSGQDTIGAGKPQKRDWVMNMNGRSYLSVFHEYARRALQKQPVYEFKQLENASTPYQATVFIGGMQYGVGHGSSKRQAKSAAARASIHILIPEMRDHLEPDNEAEPDFVFFDYVGIEDPRIAEFCAATCEPTPHAILRTCLLRNFGAGDRHIHTEMKKLEYQKIELTMKVGKHSATVVCKNKKTAKQRASQAILQALHPHVRSWGSLLRLYGSRSVKSCKEKKLEEQQITLLQDKARHNEPNYAVLDKLRREMRALRERDEAVLPVGTLLAHALPAHSASNLNNVEL